ncbi:MAG: DUF1576 domain-containing protein [Spirochaetales bacterium]|uniref:DUF1576 domain-containing protein n=1 Tax=Candidatus Thalassospirochaeta sargassi TaxID=3119039 RepID=A0AAJ1II92_9SPIO|nr:DUF1576 domain-containing protein [Spirochaetales bacterium]
MKNDKILMLFFPLLIAGFIIMAVIIDGGAALSGFLRLQIKPARLINDFFMTEGVGAALVNSAAVGLTGFLVIVINGTRLSGPTYAAIFTMMGFGLFGKTPLNILPIFAGVFFASRFALKTFKEYIIIALFGTALGPLVSAIAFEAGLPAAIAIPAGIAGGVLTGFFLPAIAVSMLHLHQGYNLYNMGLTCGFFSLFAASLLKAGGSSLAADSYWYIEPSLALTLLIPVISVLLIIVGFIDGRGGSLKTFVKIQRQVGRLPSDFIDLVSVGGSFINSGMVGLFGTVIILIIGGDFNGPVIGGLLTIMGFAAFGTHLKNSWPIVAGVIIAALVFSMPLTSPGVQLAIIFCTTLAPVAGQFGIFPGILAGFLHMLMVSQTGSWQGGMNLYNNGFSGGLVAALIVAVVQWYRSNRKEKKFK